MFLCIGVPRNLHFGLCKGLFLLRGCLGSRCRGRGGCRGCRRARSRSYGARYCHGSRFGRFGEINGLRNLCRSFGRARGGRCTSACRSRSRSRDRLRSGSGYRTWRRGRCRCRCWALIGGVACRNPFLSKRGEGEESHFYQKSLSIAIAIFFETLHQFGDRLVQKSASGSLSQLIV